MIFVTVGHQMPFDRMIQAVDRWAHANPDREVFAQIGAGRYKPRHMASESFIMPDDYQRRIVEADLIVAHAGTGTILSALRLRKPLLVMTRLSDLGETRNDHQIPTAKYFVEHGYVLIGDEHDFAEKMTELESFEPSGSVSESAAPELIQRIRRFAMQST